MQIIRRKTFAVCNRYPLMVDQTNPIFILHRKEPMSGILCLEDVVTIGNDYHALWIKVGDLKNTQFVLGRASPDRIQDTINRYYNIDRNTLETVMLATDGYVGKWAYNVKEEHYKIIGLWHLQYKPVKKSRASDRPHAIFIGPQDRAAFKRVREKKPE